MADTSDQTFTLRPATAEDLPALLSLMSTSVSRLCAASYSPSQISAMIQTLDGRYNDLINDSSYFVICAPGRANQIIASGGWNVSRSSYPAETNPKSALAMEGLSEPAVCMARVRGIYVHPEWTRRGLGTRLVRECEAAAQTSAGASKFELDSTVNAVPLYESCGYVQAGEKFIALQAAEDLTVVKMYK